MPRVVKFGLVFLAACLAILVLPNACRAQTAATIIGTVTDSTGAVVPGATIVVGQPEIGLKRQVESNANGNYGWDGQRCAAWDPYKGWRTARSCDAHRHGRI